MVELPRGTLTLLFSDIEGSTALLSRLGADYAAALDGQRTVLRESWAAHGGTEIGTEGDSFFVVFPTALAAVAAALQAQRSLAEYPWPGGERVRVRMGVHTGTPSVHDDGYVGLDVHRAARIASAAHGGQVVVSATTAGLVRASLPEGVGLLDLGAHHLKDIALAEQLFQLTSMGLPADFPPLKSLGAASSLPVPATALVGRDAELAELAALLGSPGVRLLTLSGPGGTGKTRLAVGIAQRLVEQFPDGVYFVPLAAVTAPEVMWASIGEVLDLPSEDRGPHGFSTHLAHRSVVLVLDNLEQIRGADKVVSELLTEAPRVVVIATSRRPLHVAAEFEHAVPPLAVPRVPSLAEAERSGAVQLFLQQAVKVKAGFSLTGANVADVIALCRRLDGLPLAIELAAARVKLLTPGALLARLDRALELKDTGVDRPARQQTLRDTIGWSYDLLTPQMQGFFRRLGVFSGGADLEAISAVTVDNPDRAADGPDPLDLVAELVDASLVTIAESPDGEPRVEMLETVRAYALDRLTAGGESDVVRGRHAQHYLAVAEGLRPLLDGPLHMATRTRFETEHDNMRQALDWAVRADHDTTAADQGRLGLRLCDALYGFWFASGYFAERRRWLEEAIDRAGGSDSPELASCLTALADSLRMSGELTRAQEWATKGVAMYRRLGDTSGLASALIALADIASRHRQAAAARSAFEEAAALARESGDKARLAVLLGNFAMLEASEHNFEASLELDTEALAIVRELGNPLAVLSQRHNMACTMREMGRVEEAESQMRTLIPQVLEVKAPGFLIVIAEDYAAVLAELGHHRTAAGLLGAAEAMRERLGTPRDRPQEAEIAEPIGKARAALTARDWDGAYEAGRKATVEDALTQACASSSRE